METTPQFKAIETKYVFRHHDPRKIVLYVKLIFLLTTLPCFI